MSSSILTANEICRLAEEEEMIQNFDIEKLDGLGSYDFCVGDTVWVTTEMAKPTARNIREEGELSLQPGHAYAIKSKEKLDLPDTIQVHLSLRFRLAANKLFYSGGLVDPGYGNELYFVIYNLSSSEYSIKYEDPLVRGEFRRIGEIHTSIQYKGHTRLKGELVDKGEDFEGGLNMEELLPSSPSRSREYRDWEMINHDLEGVINELNSVDNEINELGDKIQNLNETRTNTQSRLENLESDITDIRNKVTQNSRDVGTLDDNYQHIRTYLEYLLLAAVAAIIASVTFALISPIL